MTEEEFKKLKVQRRHDRFSQAALMGLLGSPHFEPGGKRKLEAAAAMGERMGEAIEREESFPDMSELAPTPEELDEYFKAIVTIAQDIASMMVKERE